MATMAAAIALRSDFTGADLRRLRRRRSAPVKSDRSAIAAAMVAIPAAHHGEELTSVGLGFALKEPLQVRRTVNHVAHMPDRLIYDCPDLLARHTAPAFTE